MFATSFISRLRRNRVCVCECLILAAVLIATASAAHEFNFSHGFKLDREIMVSEMMLLETMTIGGFALFTWRRIQEKEREIAKRMRSEQRARHLAHQDPLTQIANRRKFYKILNAAVASPPSEGAHALLLLDLNGFKQVNDRFGHRAGDLLLVTFAKRLSGALREDEMIARLGGDEFAVIARNTSGQDGANDLAARILKCLQEPVQFGSVSHRLELGVGIALITGDRVKSDELLRRADIALYRAKASNGSAVAIYRTEMHREAESVKDAGDCAELLADIGASSAGDNQLASRRTACPPRLKLVG